MELFIRAAGPADAEEIAAVQRASWHATYADMLRPESLARVERVWDAAHWRGSLERTDDRIVPLVLDGRATGVAGFGVAGPRRGGRLTPAAGFEGEIYLLYLMPGIQGYGHGGRLIAALARVLRARSMKSALVWALAANKSAIGFYRHLGASTVTTARKPFFGETVDEIALGWDDLDVLADTSRHLRK